MIDLAKLKQAAEAATKGPWAAADWTDDFGENKTTIEAQEPEIVSPGWTGIWPGGIAKKRVAETYEGENPIADAAHIANCDPQTILALVAVAEAAQAAQTLLFYAHRSSFAPLDDALEALK